MGVQPSRRPGRTSDDVGVPEDRRTWLSHGLAAVAVSALGLAVAGSMSLTTNASTTQVEAPAQTAVERPAAAPPRTGTTSGSPRLTGSPQQPSAPAGTTTGTLRAFTARPAPTTDQPRESVRVAVVTERTAQRAEVLSKTAESVSRAVRDEGSRARAKNLAATDRATRQTAVQLAQARLRAAVAARVAAAMARKDAESAPPESATPATPQAGAGAQTVTPSTDSPAVPPGGGSASPVPGAVIGAHFGQYGSWSRYHTGLDFRASYGTPIRAVSAGVVTFAGNSGDWAGNHIAIRHAGNYTSMSSHMSSMAVHSGETVRAGQVIGYVGQTGRAFGAHLHFEIYPPGVKYGDVYKAINPQPWLSRIGVRTN